MNLRPQTSDLRPQTCDLCGSTEHQFVLVTERLDGPLVRCRGCGLFYVLLDSGKEGSTAADVENRSGTQSGNRAALLREDGGSAATPLRPSASAAVSSLPASQQIANEMERLAQRARDLALVEATVEESETPWRALMAEERVRDLQRFVTNGRLLEVGSSTGEFLRAAAASSFAASGVEADRASSGVAQAQGLDCFNGTLADAAFPDQSFDVATSYHVIEHFRSPSAELRELHRVLKPGGWLIIETPNIDTFWFRLLGARWRQFIPDHIFFFTPQTLTRLCEESGFAVYELRSVGKTMSLRLFINRVSRYHKPLARALGLVADKLNANDRTINLKLGDVMRVYAQKRAPVRPANK